MTIETLPRGDIFSVPHVRGAATATGVKPSGDLDLALIAFDHARPTAGMFTTSTVAAAPVRLCRRLLAQSPYARSIVINAGNANALTGAAGERHAQAMVQRVEERCGAPGLVLSTGIIGVPLPIDTVLRGIDETAPELTEPPGDQVARAILTTDTRPKTSAALAGHFTVGGIAKGSGMIHPNMATMLAVIATDAPLGPAAVREILAWVVDRSFHEISIDGDTSTNDAVILSAAAPNAISGELSRAERAAVERAILHVARDLAAQIVRDGEGISKVMSIEIQAAGSPTEARRVAESIARSSLVKTALAGGDPNWGRILSAAGACGVPLREDDLTLKLGDHVVFSAGAPTDVDQRALAAAFERDEVSISLSLGRGIDRGRMLTTDLTRRYVEINSEYTT